MACRAFHSVFIPETWYLTRDYLGYYRMLLMLAVHRACRVEDIHGVVRVQARARKITEGAFEELVRGKSGEVEGVLVRTAWLPSKETL